jgi:broad specificity phosphatase PhoE
LRDWLKRLGGAAGVAAALALVLAGGTAVAAEQDELRQLQQEIDDHAALKPDEAHFDALQDQYDVDHDVVSGLRDRYRTKGWGEISIQLAMAKELSGEKKDRFGSTKEAVSTISSLRGADQSKPWDAIASEVGINLDPVVDSMEKTRDRFVEGAEGRPRRDADERDERREAGRGEAREAKNQLEGFREDIEEWVSQRQLEDEERAEILAEENGVSIEVIQDFRQQNPDVSWGIMSIELAMAKQLEQAGDAENLPAALRRVEELREKGQGWGRISEALRLDLAPVVREVRDARQAFTSR